MLTGLVNCAAFSAWLQRIVAKEWRGWLVAATCCQSTSTQQQDSRHDLPAWVFWPKAKRRHSLYRLETSFTFPIVVLNRRARILFFGPLPTTRGDMSNLPTRSHTASLFCAWVAIFRSMACVPIGEGLSQGCGNRLAEWKFGSEVQSSQELLMNKAKEHFQGSCGCPANQTGLHLPA